MSSQRTCELPVWTILATIGLTLATVVDARGGKGPVGTLPERTNALEFARDNEERIRQSATGVVATISTLVLAYLAVLQRPKVVDGTLALSHRSVHSGSTASAVCARRPSSDTST